MQQVCFAFPSESKKHSVKFSQHVITSFQKDVGPSFQNEHRYKWNLPHSTYSILNAPKYISRRKLELAAKIVFKTYWKVIPLDFEFIRDDPNADFTIDFSDAEHDDLFKQNPRALAYAHLPFNGGANNGTIVFNLDYLWGMKESYKNHKKVYNFLHVLIHELGHALGLFHDEHGDTNDVLDPIYSGMLELSEHDIYRLVQMFGPRIFIHWYHYARWSQWLWVAKRRI